MTHEVLAMQICSRGDPTPVTPAPPPCTDGRPTNSEILIKICHFIDPILAALNRIESMGCQLLQTSVAPDMYEKIMSK